MSPKTHGYVLIGVGVVLLLVANSAPAAAAGVQIAAFLIGMGAMAAGFWLSARKAQ